MIYSHKYSFILALERAVSVAVELRAQVAEVSLDHFGRILEKIVQLRGDLQRERAL